MGMVLKFLCLEHSMTNMEGYAATHGGVSSLNGYADFLPCAMSLSKILGKDIRNLQAWKLFR